MIETVNIFSKVHFWQFCEKYVKNIFINNINIQPNILYNNINVSQVHKTCNPNDLWEFSDINDM